MILSIFAGILSWTLAEYVLHRVLGHDVRTRPNGFASEHTRHHAEGGYFAPTWKKSLIAIAAVPAASALASLAVGVSNGVLFGVSFVTMYVVYELVHRRMHTHAGIGWYGRRMRHHHFHHHFEDPRTNHGVTTPLWDFVFGTYARPTVIHVPRKLAMPWLVEARDHRYRLTSQLAAETE